MNIDQLRNKMNYEKLSPFRKFLYGWKRNIKMMGFTGLWKYPFVYWQLKKMVDEALKKDDNI